MTKDQWRAVLQVTSCKYHKLTKRFNLKGLQTENKVTNITHIIYTYQQSWFHSHLNKFKSGHSCVQKFTFNFPQNSLKARTNLLINVSLHTKFLDWMEFSAIGQNALLYEVLGYGMFADEMSDFCYIYHTIYA